MAHRKQTSLIGLDQHSKDLVCDALVKLVLRELERAKKAIKNKSYLGGSIELADAGDWALVLTDVANGSIDNLQMLKDRVKSLHTGHEHICWNLVAEIENSQSQNVNNGQSAHKS